MNRVALRLAFRAVVVVFFTPNSHAQILTYNSGSSVKVEQVIGACEDTAQAAPIMKRLTPFCTSTASQAVTGFNVGRTVSSEGGRFIAASAYAVGSTVFLFGVGPYGSSDIHLQMVSADNFESGAGTQYFAGVDADGRPNWANTEAAAVPVVRGDPIISSLSVIYSNALGLWMMAYDSGRHTIGTRAIYFSYAAQPWGPWSTPQLIFNATPCCPASGGVFAPQLIERYTKIEGNTLRLYWNASTGDPQTVVLMRSEFAIASAAPSTPTISVVANAAGERAVIAPNTWVEIKGSNLAPVGHIRTWQESDFANGKMPTQLDGVSATVNGRSAFVYYISPTQVNVLTPPDAITASAQVVVNNNGALTSTFTVQAETISPSLFIFGAGPYVAATHANGTLIGPTTLFPSYSTPAVRGETIVLYANGFGATTVPVVSGSATQSGTLNTPPVIQIGGVNAALRFAGLVSPGEYQFNVVVPSTVPSGDLSVTALYGGVASQPGAILHVQ